MRLHWNGDASQNASSFLPFPSLKCALQSHVMSNTAISHPLTNTDRNAHMEMNTHTQTSRGRSVSELVVLAEDYRALKAYTLCVYVSLSSVSNKSKSPTAFKVAPISGSVYYNSTYDYIAEDILVQRWGLKKAMETRKTDTFQPLGTRMSNIVECGNNVSYVQSKYSGIPG